MSASAPTLIIGHSLGGSVAQYAAARISSVKAVAIIAAPNDPAHVQRLLKDNESETIKKERQRFIWNQYRVVSTSPLYFFNSSSERNTLSPPYCILTSIISSIISSMTPVRSVCSSGTSSIVSFTKRAG
ncbi:hypothetical protein FC093_21090 [Ilyomonas limi]|uniref:BAAT/Acyl-CoA thioester hydrolase C-terminal domain-containing protein n=1 Tax=Ilyomonas limi TaxID=2575867 RepID=A0A4U3KRJ4_9BACT|nr:hypothetical protein FC093_21090 [Ilyomonas limi]